LESVLCRRRIRALSLGFSYMLLAIGPSFTLNLLPLFFFFLVSFGSCQLFSKVLWAFFNFKLLALLLTYLRLDTEYSSYLTSATTPTTLFPCHLSFSFPSLRYFFLLSQYSQFLFVLGLSINPSSQRSGKSTRCLGIGSSCFVHSSAFHANSYPFLNLDERIYQN